MIQVAIRTLADGKGLNEDIIVNCVDEMVGGRASPAQMGAFLMGLKSKGETPAEIAAFASALRERAIRISPRVEGNLVDTCGTGGDSANTFNVSTVAALVAAGAGAKVAKHGNRAVSSRSGSADLLERLGFNLSVSPETVARSIEQIGIGFLFAPNFHPAMRSVAGVRRELGIRTVFNLLGPLINPAPISSQLLGVHSTELVTTMTEVLRRTGIGQALIVHASDGMDEISVRGTTLISRLQDGKVETRVYTPKELGVRRNPEAHLQVSDVDESASVCLGILSGARQGPEYDMVVVNAAAALVVSGHADTFHDGCEMSRHSIQSGEAYRKLVELVKLSGGDVGRLQMYATSKN